MNTQRNAGMYSLLSVEVWKEAAKKPAQKGRDSTPGLAILGKLDIRKPVMCMTVVGCLLPRVGTYDDVLEGGDMSVLCCKATIPHCSWGFGDSEIIFSFVLFFVLFIYLCV